MPLGKELGEFSANFTSVRVVEVDGDQTVIEGNYDGETTGPLSGVVTGTLTFSGTNERGSLEDKGVGYLATGESLTGTGRGVYWLTSPGVWETRAGITLSNGATMVAESTVTLETRSMKGKLFELA